jgi:hypothetical protein
MVLGSMRFGSPYLHKTLGADCLIATPSPVQMRGVVHETDGTLQDILVEKDLYPLPIHTGILGQLQFLWSDVSLGGIARPRSKRCEGLSTPTKEWR